MKKIGLLGGTFDPIHHGHCRLALECLEQLDLDEIRFIPCKQNVQKKANSTSSNHRSKMIELAIKDVEPFTLDRREIDRETHSYMYETVESIHSEFPEAKLYLLMGSDTYKSFPTWKNSKATLEKAELVVAFRPGTLFENHTPCLQVEFSELDISSTEIRHKFNNQKNNRYLMPDNVIQYIKQEELYEN